MKLTKTALKKINTQTGRLKLALALNCTERWISKCIENNRDNGPLTTMAAIQVIKSETGLREVEILEAIVKKAA